MKMYEDKKKNLELIFKNADHIYLKIANKDLPNLIKIIGFDVSIYSVNGVHIIYFSRIWNDNFYYTSRSHNEFNREFADNKIVAYDMINNKINVNLALYLLRRS